MSIVKNKANAIEKALIILNLFAPENVELGTNEISRILGFHRATTSRTLLSLAHYGFLEQNKETRKFKLGPTVVYLGMSFNRSLKKEIVQIAKPHIDKLNGLIQKSVALEVLSGKYTLLAYSIEGPRLLKIAGQVGDILPIHASAGAKAILAFTPPAVVDSILEREFIQITSRTITSKKEFKQLLIKIRQEGVAYDMGERDEDVNAIAAPIITSGGKAVAALDVVWLPSLIGENLDQDIILELKNTARIISDELDNHRHK